jgi:hypothetical protein
MQFFSLFSSGKSTFARVAFRRAVEDPALFPTDVADGFKEAVTHCFEAGRVILLDLGKCELGEHVGDDPVRYFTSVVAKQCSPEADRVQIWNALPSGDTAWPTAMAVLNPDKGLFVLNIDETNTLLELRWGSSALRTFVGAIAKTTGCGAFVVTLSGTHVHAQHQALDPSKSQVKDISLPMLTTKHVEEVMQDFVSRCGSPMLVNDQPMLKYAAQLLGGVPRYLEILLFELGAKNGVWSKAVFTENVSNIDCRSINAVLEQCITRLTERYCRVMRVVHSAAIHPLLCAALFQLTLSREDEIAGRTVGDFEKDGVIFLHGKDPNLGVIVTAPFLLLRYAMTKQSSPPRLIRSISSFIDPKSTEQETLRILKLKYDAFKGLRDVVTLGDLYPLRASQQGTWGCKVIALPEEASIDVVTEEIRSSSQFTKLVKRSNGALQQNCGTAPFADSWLIPSSREFAVWHQDKRMNVAKKASQIGAVRSVKPDAVQAERRKCGNSNDPRLFVYITDEHWDATNNAQLEDDVLVIGRSEHVSFFGPLLAARRLFTSENE